MKLSSLKIGTRLYSGFGLLVALLMFLQANSFLNFSKLEQAVAVSSDDADLTAALARLLASCPDRSVRDGARAGSPLRRRRR